MKKLLKKLGIEQRQDAVAFVLQFVKFGLVGCSNTLIHLLIYYTALFLGAHYILANIIGFFVGTINAFYWNNRYVFKSKARTHAKFVRALCSYGLTFLLSTGLLYLMVDIVGISDLVAPVINLAVTIPLNFLLNKFWAFR